MHPTDFPQEFLDRLVQRRGRVHAFEAIESHKTALVVVDMQNCFCAAGAAGEVPLAKELVAQHQPAGARDARCRRRGGLGAVGDSEGKKTGRSFSTRW